MNAAGVARHRATLPGQPDLTFIPEDGSPRYCKRMTKEESQKAKVIVMQLHQQGADRAAMSEEISRKVLHGRRIPKAMVDRLRDQLGLIQRQDGRAAKGQEATSRTEESSVLCSIQEDDDHTKLVPVLSAQGFENNFVIILQKSINFQDMSLSAMDSQGLSSPDLHPQGMQPQSMQPQSMEPRIMDPQIMEPQITDPQIMEPRIMDPQIMEPQITDPQIMEPQIMEPQIMEPQNMEPQNMDALDMEFQDQDMDFEDMILEGMDFQNITSQDINMFWVDAETLLTTETRTERNPPEVDAVMFDCPCPSDPSVDSERNDLTCILADQEPTKTSDVPSVMDRPKYNTPRMHPLDKSGLWTHYYHLLCQIPPFSQDSDTEARRLWESTLSYRPSSEPKWTEDCAITALYHTASILSTLRDFQQAFDTYFLIYCRLLKSLGTLHQAPDPYFVLAAIGCARSARTLSQLNLAYSLMEVVRDDLLLHRGLPPIEHTRTWKALDRFYNKSFDTENDFWENIEETAYWAATALIMSRPQLAARDGTMKTVPEDDFLPCFEQDSIVAHIYDCDLAIAALRAGISKVSAFIRHRRTDLNDLVKAEDRLDLSSAYGRTRAGQVIAYMFLDDHLRPHTLQMDPLQSSTKFDHAGFPCHWDGHVMLTIPFILVEWTQRPEFNARHASFLERGLKTNPVDFLLLAADAIVEYLHFKPGRELVVDLFLNSMAAPRHDIDAWSQIAHRLPSPGGLFELATKMSLLDHDTGFWNDRGSNPMSKAAEGGNVAMRDSDVVLQEFPDTASLNMSISTRSSYRRFHELSRRLKKNIPWTVRSQHSASSWSLTTRSSWSLSRTAGFPRDSSIRESQVTLSSDVPMSA